jgi:AcrR family transcriptional regulator
MNSLQTLNLRLEYEYLIAFAIRILGAKMAARRKSSIVPRKQPRQSRSQSLVDAILQAAIRVLTREGARRFTTIRVAEEAGISIGSLYQYFPNKEAILFKLQTDEWSATGQSLGAILADATVPPPERLRKLVKVFFQSECEEASFRVALADAAPLYRDAPESKSHSSEHAKRFLKFVAEALPHADDRQRAFCADLIKTMISAIGEKISEQDRTAGNVEQFADAVGDMLCAHLRKLNGPSRR